jgi:[acyl-carrier-protein] S-malonyltransferase
MLQEEGPMARVAFLFPGQGAQYAGMGRAPCEAEPKARELFERASNLLGYDLLEACAGPEERLNSTAVSQPAIYVASLAALEVLRRDEPGAVASCFAAAGLSLGEYPALTFARSLTFEEGLKLVQRRGEAMQAAADSAAGAMVSVVGLEQSAVEELCAKASALGAVRLANLLGPGNIVVSGEAAGCAEVERLAEQAGARTARLAVAGAFHTPLMRSAVEALTHALQGVEVRDPAVPVWANVTARPYRDAAEVRDLLARQVVEPVLWEQTVRGLLAAGCDRFYEIGPRRVLAGLLKRIDRKAECRNIAA